MIKGKIIKTNLGYEDHGIFVFQICVETEKGGYWIGDYALDSYDEGTGKRVLSEDSLMVIPEILNVVGVDNWEDLVGSQVCLRMRDKWRVSVDEIGNVNGDKWINFKEFFGN